MSRWEHCSKCGKAYNPNVFTVEERLLQAIFGEHLCPHCFAHRLYVTVISVSPIPGYGMGVTNVHRMLDNEGNLYVWFATTQALEAGEDYVIAGTVRAHKEFQGIKETILTRVKVEE